MSRHRDVRNMDYSEDYADYNEVFGRSVDDDIYISPSHRQFLFNRENSRDQPKIGEFISTEQDIQEEDESELAAKLTDLEKAKLESCLEQIKETFGPLSMSKTELTNIIISHNFDVDQVTNVILDRKDSQAERKEKDVTDTSKFSVPKLNGFKENISSPFRNIDKSQKKSFNIPSLTKLRSGENASPPKNFTVPKLNSFVEKRSENPATDDQKFNNLSDLVSNHLSRSLQKNLSIDHTANQINKISEDVSNNLKITPSSSEVISSSSDYQIDLSVALKPSSSGQSLTSKSKHDLREEKFEIPFVDCDVDLETRTVLKCTFDIQDVLKIRLQNAKPVSNFGKVLCRIYKRRRRLTLAYHDTVLRKAPRFNFTTPSPDDGIIKHLRV